MHPSNAPFYKRPPKLFRKVLKKVRRVLARARLSRFPQNAQAPRHSLSGELVISLTSFPARFGMIELTVKSLLDQSVKPDRVVLWIAQDEYDQLPPAVLALQDETFSVRQCENIRNFKKILPSLAAFPDAFIVICDDDTYYPPNWLKDLLGAFDPEHPTIVCHRAHRLAYLPNGSLAPYRQWPYDVDDAKSALPSTDLLPTGNGGVLYPPGALPPLTQDLDLIRKLSPTSDDVWLFFMWRRNDWKIKRVPGKRRMFLEWPHAKTGSLRILHRGGKKDDHLQTMSKHFGTP